MSTALHLGDCVAWLTAHAERIAAGEAAAFDSCVTDPPYHLSSIVKRFSRPPRPMEGADPANVRPAASMPGVGREPGRTGAYARASRGFMGKEWDGGDLAFRAETWRAVFDCLKPGAHLVAFSGTRTYHRMACAIEDAGFEIRDQLQWLYGSGFPKSHDVSKGLRAIWPRDRSLTRAQWQAQRSAIRREAFHYTGHGTALKPACEPICLARKPLAEKSVAANVLAHGTGALNIDGCRVGTSGARNNGRRVDSEIYGKLGAFEAREYDCGRWPANVIHDGSEAVVGGFPETGEAKASDRGAQHSGRHGGLADLGSNLREGTAGVRGHDDAGGSAARFFYSAKAGPLDRIGTKHATVKPVDLMRWLCRLITPPGGHILEPFAGSGTTGIAAMAEGFDCTMIELEAEHFADIERKLAYLRGEGRTRFVEHDRKAAHGEGGADFGPLFGDAA